MFQNQYTVVSLVEAGRLIKPLAKQKINYKQIFNVRVSFINQDEGKINSE